MTVDSRRSAVVANLLVRLRIQVRRDVKPVKQECTNSGPKAPFAPGKVLYMYKLVLGSTLCNCKVSSDTCISNEISMDLQILHHVNFLKLLYYLFTIVPLLQYICTRVHEKNMSNSLKYDQNFLK